MNTFQMYKNLRAGTEQNGRLWSKSKAHTLLAPPTSCLLGLALSTTCQLGELRNDHGIDEAKYEGY